MKLLQIDSGYYCAGIAIGQDGRVYSAAPILWWMVGKDEEYVLAYCRAKRFKVIDATHEN